MTVPPGPPSPARWFEPLADHLGAAYLRYSFTYGTEQEATFLAGVLDLQPGAVVLDVGCGPGRHVAALARRGAHVVGLDLSARFLEVAARGAGPLGDRGGSARYVRADAGALPLRPGSVDAVVSLCQGGFGLMAGPGVADGGVGADGWGASPLAGDPDGDVLVQMAQAVRPGGHVVVSAFSSYFQVRYLEDHDAFDATRGVNHERTEIRSETGLTTTADLWTSCFTPRELRLLAERAGLVVRATWSVTPGDYARRPAGTDHPELLLVAVRPL